MSENLPVRVALPQPVTEVLATAVGGAHRDDPVLPRTGGPAGNARLTAWSGLLLLALFLVEGSTLLSLRSLLSVHIVVGTVLVPLALVKTAATGWRILRYYTGSAEYRLAGPPPILLRILGPFVILTSLAVLGSGLALLPLRHSAFTPVVSAGRFGLSPLTIHKLCFVLWIAGTGAHTLVRTVPALQLVAGRGGAGQRVAGGVPRVVTLLGALCCGVVIALVVLHLSGWWTHHAHDGGAEGR